VAENQPTVILFSVPGLRPQDISPEQTPTLSRWARGGGAARIAPTFPCVTSPVQASMLTGRPPAQHGVIANGFYHRERRAVEFWVGRDAVVQGPQLWDVLKARRPELTLAVWHAQNIRDAAADFIVTPEPIHEADGTTRPWCYSKPAGLYEQLVADLGHFPLHHYWGPMSGIGSTKWILEGAAWLARRHQPDFQFVYLPHLDYAGQKFGPDSSQATAAVRELDAALSEFDRFQSEAAGGDVALIVASEYVMTSVRGGLHPNRILREAGLLKTRTTPDGEVIDFAGSKAFAMVDHQLAHVYCDPGFVDEAAGIFEGVDGVAGVYAGQQRAAVGLDHPRSGEVVLVSAEDRWFAYYWWLTDGAAPPFARTVDIHRKPGYDPVELFFDPATKGIPLDAGPIKGSHGVPAVADRHYGALLVSSAAPQIDTSRIYRDVDIYRLVLRLFGLA